MAGDCLATHQRYLYYVVGATGEVINTQERNTSLGINFLSRPLPPMDGWTDVQEIHSHLLVPGAQACLLIVEKPHLYILDPIQSKELTITTNFPPSSVIGVTQDHTGNIWLLVGRNLHNVMNGQILPLPRQLVNVYEINFDASGNCLCLGVNSIWIYVSHRAKWLHRTTEDKYSLFATSHQGQIVVVKSQPHGLQLWTYE